MMVEGVRGVAVNKVNKVMVSLTEIERDLILENTYLEDDLRKNLQLCEKRGRFLLTEWTCEDLDLLVDHVAGAGNHAGNRGLERKLDRLYDKLLAALRADCR